MNNMHFSVLICTLRMLTCNQTLTLIENDMQNKEKKSVLLILATVKYDYSQTNHICFA